MKRDMKGESRNLMNDIIPAILATSVSDLDSKLAQIPKEVRFAHIDVLEEDFWTEAGTNIDFEAHLMVADPISITPHWVDRGAKRVIVHKLDGEITKFRGKVEIGLAAELHIPIGEILSLVPEVDFIHLMSIDALGTQGDNFEPVIFDRIKQVKEKFPQLVVSVDGGINTTNYQALMNAGADRLVVGSGFKDLWKLLTKN